MIQCQWDYSQLRGNQQPVLSAYTLCSLPSVPTTTTTQVHAIIISCLIYCNSPLTDLPAFSPICTTPNPFSILVYPRVIFLKCQTVQVISLFKNLQQVPTALRSKSKFLSMACNIPGFFPSTHLLPNPHLKLSSSGHPELAAG